MLLDQCCGNENMVWRGKCTRDTPTLSLTSTCATPPFRSSLTTTSRRRRHASINSSLTSDSLFSAHGSKSSLWKCFRSRSFKTSFPAKLLSRFAFPLQTHALSIPPHCSCGREYFKCPSRSACACFLWIKLWIYTLLVYLCIVFLQKQQLFRHSI